MCFEFYEEKFSSNIFIFEDLRPFSGHRNIIETEQNKKHKKHLNF